MVDRPTEQTTTNVKAATVSYRPVAKGRSVRNRRRMEDRMDREAATPTRK